MAEAGRGLRSETSLARDKQRNGYSLWLHRPPRPTPAVRTRSARVAPRVWTAPRARGPNQSTASLTFEWDLDNNGTFETAGIAPTFSATGLDSPTTVTVALRVTDDSGLSGTDTTTVNVQNAAPSITPISVNPASINEGDSVTVSGSLSDPALGLLAEVFSGAALWSDGAATPVSVDSTAGTFTTTRMFVDDDPTGTAADAFTVYITNSDDDGGSDTATSPAVTVNNVAPSITGIVSSATFENKAAENGLVTVPGTFTDVGTLDTHTATVDWGDGNTTPAVVTESGGSGTFSASHAYTAGGVYTVTVTLMDDDTGGVATTSAVVTGVGVNGGVLQIVGSDSRDHVKVKLVGSEDVFGDFITPRHRRFGASTVTSVEIFLAGATTTSTSTRTSRFRRRLTAATATTCSLVETVRINSSAEPETTGCLDGTGPTASSVKRAATDSTEATATNCSQVVPASTGCLAAVATTC